MYTGKGVRENIFSNSPQQSCIKGTGRHFSRLKERIILFVSLHGPKVPITGIEPILRIAQKKSFLTERIMSSNSIAIQWAKNRLDKS